MVRILRACMPPMIPVQHAGQGRGNAAASRVAPRVCVLHGVGTGDAVCRCGPSGTRVLPATRVCDQGAGVPAACCNDGGGRVRVAGDGPKRTQEGRGAEEGRVSRGRASRGWASCVFVEQSRIDLSGIRKTFEYGSSFPKIPDAMPRSSAIAEPGPALSALPSTHFLPHLHAPALADRCTCAHTPSHHSHHLLARAHLFTAPTTVHVSERFGCVVHAFKVQHTLDADSDRWGVFLHYDSDGFPRTGQRCLSVHASITLTNSCGEVIAVRDMRRAFTPRASFGWPCFIAVSALRSDEAVAEDGLVGVQVRVVLAESAAAVDPDPGVWDQWRMRGLWTDAVLTALPSPKAVNGGVAAGNDGVVFDADADDAGREELEFHVHRVVLASRNEYFANLLVNNPDPTTPIPIAEHSAVLSLILAFLYTGRIPVDPATLPVATLLALHRAASPQRYCIVHLQAVIAAQLASSLTLENVVEMARVAWDARDEVLMEVVVLLLRENLARVRDRDEFRELVAGGRYSELVMRLLGGE